MASVTWHRMLLCVALPLTGCLEDPVLADGASPTPASQVEAGVVLEAGAAVEPVAAIAPVAVIEPAAVIEAAEGEVVEPQTILHLSASPGPAAAQPLAAYEWSVVQPAGSVSTFVPSAHVANPAFEANVAGTYEFTLRVWDQDGVEAPAPATHLVYVIASDAVHVELLWDTPGDPDQSDEGPDAGADLDLHFAQADLLPAEAAPWFDAVFDCYWFNPSPMWASPDPGIDDDPHLDRDDTDGAGPENLNLAGPSEGATYRIAAHYWSDHGFGTSYATLRVYLAGELVYERADVALEPHDLWDVGALSWPSGAFEPSAGSSGAPVIVGEYLPATFFGG